MDKLVGTAEIAELLGQSHSQNVHAWRRRYADFPAPVAQISGTYVWNVDDVLTWARSTGRYPPKPE